MKHYLPNVGIFGLILFTLALIAIPAVAANNAPFEDFPTITSWTSSLEGVAVDKTGNVYASVVASGQIFRFVPDGSWELFADLGDSQMGGLAIDANGDLYVAVNSGEYRGVCLIGRLGEITHIEGTEAIVYPNALAFDKEGNIYVTESFSLQSGNYGQGGIWRIPRRGAAELWLRDNVLTGLGIVLPFPCGANGIAYYQGDLYVVNSDKGLVLRIPVLQDGNPGGIEIWAQLKETHANPTMPFVMGDGLALDVHGNVYVAVVSRMAVVRINAGDMTQETLFSRIPNLDGSPLLPLDTPASLAFGTGKGGRTRLFVTNQGWFFGSPGLISFDADVPGLPLP